MTKQLTAQEIAKALADSVNNFSFNNDKFADAILQEHRTIQQNIMRGFMTLVEKWAALEETGRFDGRNEATVKMASKIVEATKSCGLPHV